MNTSEYLKNSLSSLQNAVVAKKSEQDAVRKKIDALDQEKKNYIDMVAKIDADINTMQQQIKTLQSEITIAQENERVI